MAKYNILTSEEMSKRLKPSQIRPQLDAGVYYYIWGWHKGRRYSNGPYTTEDEAYREGFAACETDFEVVGLGTHDRAEATRRLKGKELHETHDLDKALIRVKHKKNNNNEEGKVTL